MQCGGRRIEIGRNNAGVVVGVADAEKLIEDLPNNIRDSLDILVSVNLRQSDRKDLLKIVGVLEGTIPDRPNSRLHKTVSLPPAYASLQIPSHHERRAR